MIPSNHPSILFYIASSRVFLFPPPNKYVNNLGLGLSTSYYLGPDNSKVIGSNGSGVITAYEIAENVKLNGMGK